MFSPNGLRLWNTLIIKMSLIVLILELFVKECNPYPCPGPGFAKCDSNSSSSSIDAQIVPPSKMMAPESRFMSSAPASFHVGNSLKGLPEADAGAFNSNSTEKSVASSSSSSSLVPSNLPSLESGPVPGAITVSLPDKSLDNGQPVNAKETFGNSDYSNLVLKLDRDYTPTEIAEYIYSTGDENGISQIVYEMVQDGQIMSSRDDVIHFLEQVQAHLAKMKENMDQNQEDLKLEPLQQTKGNLPFGLGNNYRNFRRDNPPLRSIAN